LLADGAGALALGERGDIDEKRACQALDVDAPMVVKAPVFGGDGRFLQIARHGIELHEGALFFKELLDEFAVGGENLGDELGARLLDL
jgi:hypothetical protein